MTLLELFEIYHDFKYDIDYYWDNTYYKFSMKNNGYMIDEDKYEDLELDEEYSFYGDLEDFKKYSDEYTFYKDLDIKGSSFCCIEINIDTAEHYITVKITETYMG